MSESPPRLLGVSLLLGLCAGLPGVRAQTLPPEFPLPAGITLTQVQRVEFGQDELYYQSDRGNQHVKISGHLWKAFFKGTATVAVWKAALEPAGWKILNPTPGNTVAQRNDWWAKIGLDRLTLIQQVAAEKMVLTPPGQTIESLQPNQDVPYLAPLPATVRKAWKTEEFFELQGTRDTEVRILGPAVWIRYEGSTTLSTVEIQTRYSAALQAAGWDVVRSESGGLVGAHFTQHGRDVWAKITPLSAAYTVEVADMGAAAAPDRLARQLDTDGHIALYGIYFDTDKSILRPDSEPTLVQIQKLLASRPTLKVEVQGHTDNTGTRPHNDTLSQERAASVKGWLVQHGIDGGRLTAKGYADTKPVAPNGTVEGRARNRRVELLRLP